MAFKNLDDYKKEKYGGKFILQNDGDNADVVFLYRSTKDVMVADCHYIKSPEYSGYVHCSGRGCPACEKGVRVQSKLFIPVYNLTANGVQFWDRTPKFEPQLAADVFNRFPDPSGYVFKITRNGAANDINTRYNIQAINRCPKNLQYDELTSSMGITFPDYYENICKDVDTSTLTKWLNASSSSSVGYGGDSLPEYVATPRVSVQTPQVDLPELPESDMSDDELGEVDFGD